MGRRSPVSREEKQYRISLIAAWFVSNDNKWATKESIVDSVEGLVWDSVTQTLMRADKSDSSFEIRYERVEGKIFKTPKREYRLKPELYEQLRNTDVATATADDNE